MLDEDDSKDVKGIVPAEEDNFYSRNLPKGYLSVSQVTQYLKCGEAYRRRYVLEQPIKMSGAAAQGRSIHKAAELLHVSMIESKPLGAEEVVQIYADTHAVEMKDAVLSEEDGTEGALKDAGVRMVRKYHSLAVFGGTDDSNKLIEPLKPVAAEKQFKVRLPVINADPVPFVGVIDLEEEHGIADLKTKSKAASQLDTDNSLQLSIYAHVLGKPQVRLDQLIKPTKTLPARYIRTVSYRTRAEALHAVDVIADVAADIAAGRFRRTNPENWWCTEKWCNYWADCRGRKR
jgi:hypothetical protein